jgi:hypothetical protein
MSNNYPPGINEDCIANQMTPQPNEACQSHHNAILAAVENETRTICKETLIAEQAAQINGLEIDLEHRKKECAGLKALCDLGDEHVLRLATEIKELNALIEMDKHFLEEKDKQITELREALVGMVMCYPYLNETKYLASLKALKIQCKQDLQRTESKEKA